MGLQVGYEAAGYESFHGHIRSNKVAIAVIGTFLYLITRTIYRVTLSPLARFPGPKLAGMKSILEIKHVDLLICHLPSYHEPISDVL
jgi:hypothetical protein